MQYNRQNVLNYAKKWAFSRNPDYYNFDSLGGDCTNFTSQCIYAGANVMNFTKDVGWYYRTVTNRAAAWTGVEFLHRFLTRNIGAGPFAQSFDDVNFAEVGDIIQLNFNGINFGHSLIVTATSPEILVATHTADAFDRQLFTYSYERHRLLKIMGVRRA